MFTTLGVVSGRSATSDLLLSFSDQNDLGHLVNESVKNWSLTHNYTGFSYAHVNPLECKGNYSATMNNMKLAHWPLIGGLFHLVQQGAAHPFLAVPNVTTQPSTASVPITVLLLYDGPLLCSLNVTIKELTDQ